MSNLGSTLKAATSVALWPLKQIPKLLEHPIWTGVAALAAIFIPLLVLALQRADQGIETAGASSSTTAAPATTTAVEIEMNAEPASQTTGQGSATDSCVSKNRPPCTLKFNLRGGLSSTALIFDEQLNVTVTNIDFDDPDDQGLRNWANLSILESDQSQPSLTGLFDASSVRVFGANCQYRLFVSHVDTFDAEVRIDAYSGEALEPPTCKELEVVDLSESTVDGITTVQASDKSGMSIIVNHVDPENWSATLEDRQQFRCNLDTLGGGLHQIWLESPDLPPLWYKISIEGFGSSANRPEVSIVDGATPPPEAALVFEYPDTPTCHYLGP